MGAGKLASPVGDVGERGLLCDVKHEEAAMGAAVIGGGQTAELLLTCNHSNNAKIIPRAIYDIL